MKVLTVLGTRPEIIKLSRVMTRLDELCDHVVAHTGQNYDLELSGNIFRDLGMRMPNHFLAAARPAAAETIANVISSADRLLEKIKPDALLILGDTNSTLCAIPAKRRKIPVFHMEAGNRCFDERVPEEINRRIVDHISDINLPYSEHARGYLLSEGIPPDRIFKTGSPMKEVLEFHRTEIEASTVLERLKLISGQYLVASLHREENVDDPLRLIRLIEALHAAAREHRMPLIFSTHPRTRKRLLSAKVKLSKQVRSMPPLGFFDYVALQKNAACTLSDSGTIAEEASILGFPAVAVREAHERPEAMDEGAFVMSGLDTDSILSAMAIAIRQQAEHGPSAVPKDYLVDQVSWKVAKIIFSYVGYVNRTVWRR